MSHRRIPSGNLNILTFTNVNTVYLSIFLPLSFNRIDSANITYIDVVDDSVALLPIGCSIFFQQIGTGPVVFNVPGIVNLTSSSGSRMIRKQWSIVTLTKLGPNTWSLSGDLAEGFVYLIDDTNVQVSGLNPLQALAFNTSTTRNILAPVGDYPGAKILFRFTQNDGTQVVTWDPKYEFTTGVPAPTLSTVANAIDYVAFIYCESSDKWHCLATNANGYT